MAINPFLHRTKTVGFALISSIGIALGRDFAVASIEEQYCDQYLFQWTYMLAYSFETKKVNLSFKRYTENFKIQQNIHKNTLQFTSLASHSDYWTDFLDFSLCCCHPPCIVPRSQVASYSSFTPGGWISWSHSLNVLFSLSLCPSRALTLSLFLMLHPYDCCVNMHGSIRV